jgi:ABC-type multidrug transport system fused ATPase/permease subunit
LQPTSALDQMSEKLILKSLDALRKSGQRKTCIVVAHRLSTIEDSDTIFVLKNGEIMEHGPYEKLLSLRGLLYDMVCQQVGAGM